MHLPGTYTLALSNVPTDCGNTMPTLPCSPGGVTYTVEMQLPSMDLAPGVYALSDLNSFFSETGPHIDTPSSC